MSNYIQSMTKVTNNILMPTTFKLSGPQKISTKDRCAFSIPAGLKFGCPGATKACEECYAKNNRHMWNPVQRAFAGNWKLLKYFEKNEETNRAAEMILNGMRKGPGIFRLYESGDFDSQWVIYVWEQVIKARRDVNFWAYTRSFHLTFTNLTRNSNFALWASTDEYNLAEAKKFVRRFRKSGVKHAYGPWDPKVEIPPNSFVCPVTAHTMGIKGACEKCKLCVIKKKTHKNVVFLRH